MTAKTALITGAGQGMGRAIALKFAAADIRTVLVGTDRIQAAIGRRGG